MKILRLLEGEDTVCFDGYGEGFILSFLEKNGIRFTILRENQTERNYVVLSHRERKRLDRILRERGNIRYVLLAERGLPPYVRRFFNRPGLVLGSIGAVIVWLFLTRYAWDIQVTVKNGETEAGRELLERYGVTEGMPLNHFDPDEKETEILVGEKNISRVVINRLGTVLYSEIVMKEPTEASVLDGEVTKLVADYDGVVQYTALESGKPAVSPGQCVTKGEVLAWGIEGGTNVYAPFRFGRAEGEVMAQVFEVISFDFPFLHETKQYTGEIGREIYLSFFKKNIKIFSNCSFFSEKCDIIDDRIAYTFPSALQLPFAAVNRLCLPYSETTVQLTVEQAKEGAKELLRRKTEERFGDGRITQQQVSMTKTAAGIHVEAATEAMCNIAREVVMTQNEITAYTSDGDGVES